MSNNVTHPQPDITWHVLGAGAMGCLWAAHIRQDQLDGLRSCQSEVARDNVNLILRNQQVLESYSGSVTLEHAGQTRVLQVDAQYAGAMDGSPAVTHLLVATKAQDTISAIDTIAHLLSERTVIVLLQNGIKVQREISARFGKQHIMCLSTSHGAWLRSPFHVVHAGAGDTWLGQPDADEGSAPELVNQIWRHLPQQSLTIQIDEDIKRRLWQKFAVNCAINALTVIHDCANGELLTRPHARRELQALTDEIMLLLGGIPAAPAMPELADRVLQVVQQTADNISSTLQDIRRGRHTEIEHFNGYLCELADAQQLPCPLNRHMLAAVKARESGYPHSL
jgi:2-dehydropantoate 2-reductase